MSLADYLIIRRISDSKARYLKALKEAKANNMKLPQTELVTAEWIKERRKQKGYTQTDLANLTGTTKNLIARYEAGDRNPSGPAKAALWYVLKD